MRAILTYHSIDPSGSVVSIDPATFRRQVDILHNRVRVVSLESLLALSTDEHAVAITFDDGFENFESIAWPILRDRGMPVTLFVVTDRVGHYNDWNGGRTPVPRLPLLSWDSLARLAEQGVRLGSHTRSHARLTSLDAVRLEDELVGSAQAIESRAGFRPGSFAYPYGEHDDGVTRAVARSYAHACTTAYRALAAREPSHLLPRLDMYYFRKPGALDAWGTSGFKQRLRFRRWARSLRRRLPVDRMDTAGRAEVGAEQR